MAQKSIRPQQRRLRTGMLLTPTSLKSLLLMLGIAACLLLLWRNLGPSQTLQTSTLNTSFNRLSSTEVQLAIVEPGKLRISAGPSAFIGEAQVFGLIIASSEATPANATEPFLISSAYNTVFNLVDNNDPNEYQLAITFPAGQFTTQSSTIAELPFTTTQEGQFTVRQIKFGSLPANSFPPLSDYSIYIDSSNILFNADGSAKQVQQPTSTPTQPSPNTITACANQIDDDGDGEIDLDDPGCDDPLDNDEANTNQPAALRPDVPSQFLQTTTRPDGQTEYLVILPAAQEQLQYEFLLGARGGTGSGYQFSLRGQSAGSSVAIGDSGLLLDANGRVYGDSSALKAGNYTIQLSLSDGQETVNFGLQVAVHDPFGNPIQLVFEASLQGSQTCVIDQFCEGFFRAVNGIPPVSYRFSGELPLQTNFFQVNSGEMFYRFIPTIEQVGEYNITVFASDASQQPASESSSFVLPDDQEEEAPSGQSASFGFTLIIEAPEIETTFRFSAERECEFLDLSNVEPAFEYFLFTCRNGIIEGFEGVVRAADSLNRAEAAKITSLIVADEDQVSTLFLPFVNLAPNTIVNYNDVGVSDWFAPYVYYLFRQGIIIDNVAYRPSDTLNAAEAMKLIVESYTSLSEELLNDLEDIGSPTVWFEPYQSIAQYVDADIGYIDPSLPAQRGQIAELLYKLFITYPSNKFQ